MGLVIGLLRSILQLQSWQKILLTNLANPIIPGLLLDPLDHPENCHRSTIPSCRTLLLISFQILFKEQAIGLIRGGVDLILIETSQDILEVKAVIHGVHRAFEETGDISYQFRLKSHLDTTGRMLLGTDITAVEKILDGLAIDVIGLNCSTGPDYMREPINDSG